MVVIAMLVVGFGASARAGIAAAVPASSAESATLVRVTSSFEVSYVGPVLRRVAKLFHAGFVRQDAATLADTIAMMPADEPQTWHYTVLYQGVRYPLQVRALLDDLGMLDLDFSTDAALAPSIRRVVDDYLNAKGL